MRPMHRALLVAVIALSGGCAVPAAEPAPSDRPILADLVQTVELGRLAPPSPDASGITYDDERDKFIIVDSEVEEGRFYRGVNMWTLTRRGVIGATGSTLKYSREPSGVALDPRTRRLFVSDDNNDQVFEVRAGRDSRLGTNDDVRSQTDVRIFGDKDTEDIAFDTSTGDLLLIDAKRGRIHRLGSGPNRRFDGVPPHGDDTSCSIDISGLGATDVEGISYDARRGTIFLVSHRTAYIYEVTSDGRLVSLIDISEVYPSKAAGLALAPASSGDGSRSIYIVDRGVDNNKDATARDGTLYEFRVRLPPHDRNKRKHACSKVS